MLTFPAGRVKIKQDFLKLEPDVIVTVEMLIGRKRIPQSVVRDAFYLIMETIQNRIKKIERVKTLYYPGTLKEFMSLGNTQVEFRNELIGLIHDKTIYINDVCNKHESISTLIHEVAHLLFDIEEDGARSELNAITIEKKLMRQFSREQKEALWALIPKSATMEKYPL